MCNCCGVQEEEEEAEKVGWVLGKGVSSCRRFGTWQGEKPEIDGVELVHSSHSLDLVNLLAP